jgi:hypothetical protein
MYRDIVNIIGEEGEEEPKHGRIDITEKTKFYIDEENCTQIRNRFGEGNESVLVLVAGVIGMIILGVLLTIVLIPGLA